MMLAIKVYTRLSKVRTHMQKGIKKLCARRPVITEPVRAKTARICRNLEKAERKDQRTYLNKRQAQEPQSIEKTFAFLNFLTPSTRILGFLPTQTNAQKIAQFSKV